jgi:hypothetical protein
MSAWTKKKPMRPLQIGLHFQLVSTEDASAAEMHSYCPTCTDEALPGRVQQLDEEHSTALVEINGQAVEVDVSLVDNLAPGQTVLVHGGVAIGSGEPGAF